MLPKLMSPSLTMGSRDGYPLYHDHRYRHGAYHLRDGFWESAAPISAKASICFTSDLREDLFAKVQEFSLQHRQLFNRLLVKTDQ